MLCPAVNLLVYLLHSSPIHLFHKKFITYSFIKHIKSLIHSFHTDKRGTHMAICTEHTHDSVFGFLPKLSFHSWKKAQDNVGLWGHQANEIVDRKKRVKWKLDANHVSESTMDIPCLLFLLLHSTSH